LRARDFNVNVALKLLTETISWRANFQGIGVDAIKEETIQNELKSGKAFQCGVDKSGRPVVYVRVRFHKRRQTDQSEFQRYLVFLMEQSRVLKVLHGPTESATVVFDMRDFSMENMDYSFTKFLVDVTTTRYPETLGAGLVVDSPVIFWACWKIIKPWLDQRTVSKIHFIASNELPNWIEKDQLIKDFGGKSSFEYRYPPLSGTTSVGAALAALAALEAANRLQESTNTNTTTSLDNTTTTTETPLSVESTAASAPNGTACTSDCTESAPKHKKKKKKKKKKPTENGTDVLSQLD